MAEFGRAARYPFTAFQKEPSMSTSPNAKRRSNDEWIVVLICLLFKAAARLLWLTILFPAISIPAYISWTVMMR